MGEKNYGGFLSSNWVTLFLAISRNATYCTTTPSSFSSLCFLSICLSLSPLFVGLFHSLSFSHCSTSFLCLWEWERGERERELGAVGKKLREGGEGRNLFLHPSRRQKDPLFSTLFAHSPTIFSGKSRVVAFVAFPRGAGLPAHPWENFFSCPFFHPRPSWANEDSAWILGAANGFLSRIFFREKRCFIWLCAIRTRSSFPPLLLTPHPSPGFYFSREQLSVVSSDAAKQQLFFSSETWGGKNAGEFCNL